MSKVKPRNTGAHDDRRTRRTRRDVSRQRLSLTREKKRVQSFFEGFVSLFNTPTNGDDATKPRSSLTECCCCCSDGGGGGVVVFLSVAAGQLRRAYACEWACACVFLGRYMRRPGPHSQWTFTLGWRWRSEREREQPRPDDEKERKGGGRRWWSSDGSVLLFLPLWLLRANNHKTKNKSKNIKVSQAKKKKHPRRGQLADKPLLPESHQIGNTTLPDGHGLSIRVGRLFFI